MIMLGVEKKSDYEAFSEKAQEVAPKIENLIQGLSIKEVEFLFYRIREKIERDTKVASI